MVIHTVWIIFIIFRLRLTSVKLSSNYIISKYHKNNINGTNDHETFFNSKSNTDLFLLNFRSEKEKKKFNFLINICRNINITMFTIDKTKDKRDKRRSSTFLSLYSNSLGSSLLSKWYEETFSDYSSSTRICTETLLYHNKIKVMLQ